MTLAGDALRLAEALREERALYQEMAEISRRQSEMVAEEHLNEIMQILREKQAVIDRVAKLEAEIGPVKAAWETMREQITPEQRAEVESAMDGLREVLETVIDLEATSREGLSDRREGLRREVAELERGRGAARAYGQQRPRSTGGVIDGKS